MKTLYIIAGCNGAGKTTASKTLLPEIWDCKEYVNADAIAFGLSPYNREEMSIAAGKIMLMRIEELLEQNSSFSIETTLSTRSYVRLVDRAHEKGYVVTLLFFWLSSPEMAIQRVAARKAGGGHGIDTDVIIRRYYAGIKNFKELYKDRVDSWTLVDNSMNPRWVVADNKAIYDQVTYDRIMNQVAVKFNNVQ